MYIQDHRWAVLQKMQTVKKSGEWLCDTTLTGQHTLPWQQLLCHLLPDPPAQLLPLLGGGDYIRIHFDTCRLGSRLLSSPPNLAHPLLSVCAYQCNSYFSTTVQESYFKQVESSLTLTIQRSLLCACSPGAGHLDQHWRY